MKGRIVSGTLRSSIQWHWESGRQHLVRVAERSRLWVLEDGSHFQETLDSGFDSSAVPHVFEETMILWRRFLKRNAIPEFQLRLDRHRIRIWRPGPKTVTLLPEWTLAAKAAGPLDGGGHVSHGYRALLPPNANMMSDLKLLIDAPRIEPQQTRPGPIFIRGDLLIRYLAESLEHLVSRSGEHGSWRRRNGPGLITDSLAPIDGPSETNAKPVFGRFIFLPRVRRCLSDAAWRAIDYHAGRRHLYCVRTTGLERKYMAAALSQPLYRLFHSLRFGTKPCRAMAKGIDYEIPSAILDPDPH